MTHSQFVTLRSALVSSSILIERDLAKAKNKAETRYVQRMAQKIDAGLRIMNSLADERTDQPQERLAMEAAS